MHNFEGVGNVNSAPYSLQCGNLITHVAFELVLILYTITINLESLINENSLITEFGTYMTAECEPVRIDQLVTTPWTF